MHADWIKPGWPAPPRVHAVSTTRDGGVSTGVYASLNLGQHVGDDPTSVLENRRRLAASLELGGEPRWLEQVHGKRVVHLEGKAVPEPADAAVAGIPGEACVIMTADCLPVLFCDTRGARVAAAHAGWRGLAAGVLEAAVRAMDMAPGELLAWMGPAIGPEAYEVGEEVRRAFLDHAPRAVAAFTPGKGPGKWQCDLYMLARQRLEAAGVRQIYGGGYCTHKERKRFFSFRRDGECGRMASLIWLA